MSFTYDIIATGSTGNAVSIEYTGTQSNQKLNILIDIGIPFKRLEKAVKKAQFIFISHQHQDHLNKSAYKKIRIEHPKKTVIVNKGTADFLKEKGLPAPTVVIESFKQFTLGELLITPIENEHGVDCQGFILESPDKTLLYATDLSTTLHYKDYLTKVNKQVDTLLLEANYDINVFEFYCFYKGESIRDLFNNGTFRHLPIQEHDEFAKQFLSQDGIAEKLHQSSTYASIEGLIKKMNSEADKRGMRHVERIEYDTWINKQG